MVGAQFFQTHVTHIANMGRWLSVTSTAATLIGLSALNALHGPAYDCVRAGAYLLRSRRGPFVPVVQLENSAERSAGGVRMIPVFILPLKESSHVRD
jgi:hypothetical protein